MVRALVRESRCCRGEVALEGSGNRESVAGLYRLSSRMRGRAEVRLVWVPGNNARKGRVRTKEPSSSANISYTSGKQKSMGYLLESYSNEVASLRGLQPGARESFER